MPTVITIYAEGKMNYTSNLTNEQWSIIEPMIPNNKGKGIAIEADMREVVNRIKITPNI